MSSDNVFTFDVAVTWKASRAILCQLGVNKPRSLEKQDYLQTLTQQNNNGERRPMTGRRREPLRRKRRMMRRCFPMLKRNRSKREANGKKPSTADPIVIPAASCSFATYHEMNKNVFFSPDDRYWFCGSPWTVSCILERKGGLRRLKADNSLYDERQFFRHSIKKTKIDKRDIWCGYDAGSSAGRFRWYSSILRVLTY